MSIKSSAFGRVTLTKQDAEKFIRQVTYGRISSTATDSVNRGVDLSRKLKKSGRVTVKISVPDEERKSA